MKKISYFRSLQSALFLAILFLNGLVGGFFVKLVNFRALTGWEDEIGFDSLTFNWKMVRGITLAFFLAGTAGTLLGLFTAGFYRRFGWVLALAFLTGMAYPWGLAFHYVRSFHFILLFGILVNAYGFLVLAFFKGPAGLLEEAGGTGKKMDEFKQIGVEEAGKMLGKAVFVDVRDPGSYQAAHVPGALHLTDDNIADFVAKADKSKPVVCYCYHGNTSQGAAAYLMDQGFQEVYSVMGGFEEWRQTEKIES